MKKVISFLLVLCMCFSIATMFTACSDPSKEEKSATNGEKEEQNGWLLPTKITASNEEFELSLTWDDTSCTFSAEDTTYSFVYDEDKSSLSVYVEGGADYTYEDLCVFDVEDRIQTINFQGRTVMQLSYTDDKMTISAYGEDELAAPKEIIPDWDNRKIPMPPFNNPDSFLFFTEWGDLQAGDDKTLYSYEYDEHGNALSIAMSDLGDYSWSISYGDTPMTKAWQRTVLKFIMTYSTGRPMSVFAMDMMCFAAYQQHAN